MRVITVQSDDGLPDAGSSEQMNTNADENVCSYSTICPWICGIHAQNDTHTYTYVTHDCSEVNFS